jgi:hypothetical protein
MIYALIQSITITDMNSQWWWTNMGRYGNYHPCFFHVSLVLQLLQLFSVTCKHHSECILTQPTRETNWFAHLDIPQRK